MWSSGNRCAAQMALVPVGSDRIWKAQACREVEAQGPSQGLVLKGQKRVQDGAPVSCCVQLVFRKVAEKTMVYGRYYELVNGDYNGL